MCIGPKLFFGMVASLAFLSVVRALTIDGQLTLVKNDCYERLAIGQRLNPRNVYKSYDNNTLTECQMVCTEQQNSCKAFSFGIGTTGNATCEISVDLVKETADLKPIGTVADTDYDLYIKKMGCSVVIDNSPHINQLPEVTKPEYESKPDGPQYLALNGNDKPPYPSDHTNHHYLPPDDDEIHHVRTGVSVASGPQTFLHPIHDILIGENPYEYGKHYGIKYYKLDKQKGGCCEKPVSNCCDKGDRPPFRPPALNHPYDDHRPPYRPNEDRPEPGYDTRPGNSRPHWDYGPGYDSRPGDPRPLLGHDERPGDFRPHFDYGSDDDRRPGGSRRPHLDYNSHFDTRPGGSRPHIDYGPDDDVRPGGSRPHIDYGPDDDVRPGGYRPYLHDNPDYDTRPGPSRPNSDYGPAHGSRPGNSRPPLGYEEDRPSERPYGSATGLDDRYDNYKLSKPFLDRYGSNFRKYSLRRYGSVIPHPDEYNKRPGDNYIDPEDGRYDDRPPKRPNYDRPNGPEDDYPDYHYDKPSRPFSDSQIYNDKKPISPKPYPDAPGPLGDGYAKPYPEVPRPLPIDDGYGKPYPEAPRPDGGNYGKPYPDTPRRPPIDDGYRKPYPEGPRPPLDDGYRKPYPEGPRPTIDDGYRKPYPEGPRPPVDDGYRKPYPEGPRPPVDDGYRKPYPEGPRPPDDDGYRKPYPEGPRPPVNDGYRKPYPERPRPPPVDDDYRKPYPEGPRPSSADDSYDNKPNKPDSLLDSNNPNDGYSYDKPVGGNLVTYDDEKGAKVTHNMGPDGKRVTSIITEIKEACFRRVLAGKRVARRCVKRALTCETVEQCQRECAEEKRFICEGFNYRLDPSGRGKGDCELLDLPLSQLDIGRDLYSDPDYDYYERDRNAASLRCKQWPRGGYPFYPAYSDGHYGGDRGSGGHDYHRGNYGSDYHRNGPYSDRPYDGPQRPDYKGGRGPPDYDSGLRRPGDRWAEDDHRHGRPRPDSDRRHDGDYGPSGNRRGDFSYHHSHSQHDYESSHYYYNDRDRYDYHGNRRYSGIHYLPAYYYKPYYERDRYDHKSYGPYLPPKRYPDRSYQDGYDNKYYNREKDRGPWGFNHYRWGSYGGLYGNFGHSDYNGYYNQYFNRNRYDIDRRNYYLPPKTEYPKDWGLYGGSYGNGGGYYTYDGPRNQQSYNYYGFNKYEDNYNNRNYYHDFYDDTLPSRKPLPRPSGGGYLPPSRLPSNRYPPGLPGGSYLPAPPRPSGGNYLPAPARPPGGGYLPLPAKPSIYDGHYGHGIASIPFDHFDNSILPAEPRRPFTYDFIKDECSLRSAAGFRLHKGIVKKFYAVPNIYECEVLCFKEKDFLCQSYAYRYTASSPTPTYNCYLSNKNYKELDHYTDLEPDRDFDIYTMNNRVTCEAPVIPRTDYSDCFWRVRSGQRLDQKVVRDSLSTKSIVECQIECLRSTRFTCRAFSFRYGSPVIGGVIDNCQLTDCPYYDLDPRVHFVPEPGFEVYERGSFGHGCEPDHFGIGGSHKKDSGIKVDQLCYIGFGSPARLLPQASKKLLYATTELECKAECSKLREGTLFQCMSFSYRAGGPKSLPNCILSDILQRDLLPHVDYIYDPDSWLFAWDNYNPECIALAHEPVHSNDPGKGNGIYDKFDWDVRYPLDTWRIYSVSGWPCRRGSLCQENKQAGFWYCELEGGDKNTWDYCCRPDHQCGASNGYLYQWCYVGPVRTQWRKCSDRYYPYVYNIIHKIDVSKPYLPPAQTSPWAPPPIRPGVRPDRPPAPHVDPPPRPSLDEYETQFDNEFLDPPKPGGFGQARHWPVSYLHQEMPPNTTTDSEPRLMRLEKEDNPKYAAIKKLIDVIKNNDLQNVQYHISNNSNKEDDVLFVKIPLPTNFSQESQPSKENTVASNTSISLEPVYSDEADNIQVKRSQKSLPLTTTRTIITYKEKSNRYSEAPRPTPIYRRGFVTRTNITHKWQTAF